MTTPTLVQFADTVLFTNLFTISATLSSTTTAGNALVAGLVWASFTDATIVSIVDAPGGNSWHQAVYLQDSMGGGGSSGDGVLITEYAWNIGAAAADTLTITMNDRANANYAVLDLSEWSGVQSSADPLRAHTGVLFTGASSIPSVTLNGTVAGDLAYAVCGSFNGQTSVGVGWSAVGSTANFTIFESQIAAGVSVTATSGPADTPWSVTVVAFKPQASTIEQNPTLFGCNF